MTQAIYTLPGSAHTVKGLTGVLGHIELDSGPSTLLLPECGTLSRSLNLSENCFFSSVIRTTN